MVQARGVRYFRHLFERLWATSWIGCNSLPTTFAGFFSTRQLEMTGGYGGRKLFVGGLPPKVDEKALRDVFSRFWHIEEGL